MPEPKASKDGVYVDTRTGVIVDAPPEEGVQLCPPGGLLTPEIERNIDDARDAFEGVSKVRTTTSAGFETADADGQVETSADTKKK